MRRAFPLLGALLLLAGCGTGGKASSTGDQANGAKLFKSTCGGCHVLAAAGSQGTTGPNLDDAFSGSKKQGFKLSTIENVVLDQIREANPPMPKNLVKGQAAVDVAAYVAAVSGQGGSAAAGVAARHRRQGDLPGGVLELPHACSGEGDGHDRSQSRSAEAAEAGSSTRSRSAAV